MKIRSILILALALVVSQVEANPGVYPSSKESSYRAENDPMEIIANYIKAVGGAEKVNRIKNASMTAEANFQGQVIEIKTISDSENSRMMQSTSVSGNVMQKTVLMNGKGQMVAMGQVQELPEETVALLKSQTYVFPEPHFEMLGYKVAYIGQEAIGGEDAHNIQITAPNGMVTNEYYSLASGLKIRTSSAATGDITYSDYKEVEGVLFPMLLTIKNPMLPVALEAKMISVKFNQTLSDADFQ